MSLRYSTLLTQCSNTYIWPSTKHDSYWSAIHHLIYLTTESHLGPSNFLYTHLVRVPRDNQDNLNVHHLEPLVCPNRSTKKPCRRVWWSSGLPAGFYHLQSLSKRLQSWAPGSSRCQYGDCGPLAIQHIDVAFLQYIICCLTPAPHWLGQTKH